MSHINITQHDDLLELKINRPEKMNALSRQMYLELANAINYANRDDNTRVILIQGHSHCFSAGNDIQDFMQMNKALSSGATEVEQFMQALLMTDLPVVAKVEGLAVGIGTTMLLHCDFVYCNSHAQFQLPFINLGLVPEYASSYLLPRIVGHVKANEWLMLGEKFSAQEAFESGLINGVYDGDALDNRVNMTISQLAQKPQNALRETKRLLKEQRAETHQHMQKELTLFAQALQSPEALNAFNQFAAKQ